MVAEKGNPKTSPTVPSVTSPTSSPKGSANTSPTCSPVADTFSTCSAITSQCQQCLRIAFLLYVCLRLNLRHHNNIAVYMHVKLIGIKKHAGLFVSIEGDQEN